MEDKKNFLQEIEEENKVKARPKLYKESSFKRSDKNIAPVILNREEIMDISDSDDEEEKDVMMESGDKMGDLPMPQSMFTQAPTKFTGRVQATIPAPEMPDVHKPPRVGKATRSYKPVSWEDAFEEREMLDDVIPVYHSGTTGPIIFCIHGAGHSALSFGPLAKATKDFARVVAFDLRGHGGHFHEDEIHMPIEVLQEESMYVLKHIIEKYDDASIIITGHSLGGSIAAKLTFAILHPEEGKEPDFESKHITGVFVIDVAEGSAIGALPFMEQIVESRPSEFESIEEAVKYGVVSGQVRNLPSAKLTMPDQVIEKDGKIVWRTDLLSSKEYWKNWFVGMND
mmetsp:Transcript_5563/g.4755  ORF Transcript_5563/g.4755 Transcript_5563/m.4755 type:complete len:341 (+) Transcript_5563:2-1024(+)